MIISDMSKSQLENIFFVWIMMTISIVVIVILSTTRC